MFNIEEYLRKFSKEVRDFEQNKNKILEIIEKQTQLYILPKNLEIKEAVMYINDSPAVKNKIFIYKEKILEDISKSLQIKIVDIR